MVAPDQFFLDFDLLSGTLFRCVLTPRFSSFFGSLPETVFVNFCSPKGSETGAFQEDFGALFRES